ncbi:MAG: hypothetical protein NT154_18330 [Verrucomicrobia bacterium]|nr:hypothetical protein [Verrucomicrobiota bacterium]
MELVEPETVFARRCGLCPANGSPALSQAQWQPPRPLGDDFWTTAVFDALRDHGDEPMKFTNLVNAVARLGNYSRRADYDRKRVELFKLVGRLILTGRLDRVGRKHVAIPRTDARRWAYLTTASQPLELPPPSL